MLLYETRNPVPAFMRCIAGDGILKHMADRDGTEECEGHAQSMNSIYRHGISYHGAVALSALQAPCNFLEAQRVSNNRRRRSPRCLQIDPVCWEE